jgi:hypothetical protein
VLAGRLDQNLVMRKGMHSRRERFRHGLRGGACPGRLRPKQERSLSLPRWQPISIHLWARFSISSLPAAGIPTAEITTSRPSGWWCLAQTVRLDIRLPTARHVVSSEVAARSITRRLCRSQRNAVCVWLLPIPSSRCKYLKIVIQGRAQPENAGQSKAMHLNRKDNGKMRRINAARARQPHASRPHGYRRFSKP